MIPILLGYLVGSLPAGFLLARRMRGVDLRRVGSGNVGAANVYRTSGLAFGLAVMALDMAKGAGSVALAARLFGGEVAPVSAGAAAVLGHVFPVWLRFRGGKGVATACGVFAVLTPLATAAAAVVFLAGVWATRYISVGSIAATAALPPLAFAIGAPVPVVAGGILSAMVILTRHRDNLSRVLAGTERRVGQRA